MRLCWKGWIAALLLAAPIVEPRSCLHHAIGIAAARPGRAGCGRPTDFRRSFTTGLWHVADGAVSRCGAGLERNPWCRGGWRARGEGRPGPTAELVICLMLPRHRRPPIRSSSAPTQSGALTVTLTMHALPPGKYAVVLADAAGAPLGGQWGSSSSGIRPERHPDGSLADFHCDKGSSTVTTACGTGRAPAD